MNIARRPRYQTKHDYHEGEGRGVNNETLLRIAICVKWLGNDGCLVDLLSTIVLIAVLAVIGAGVLKIKSEIHDLQRRVGLLESERRWATYLTVWNNLRKG